MRLLLQFQKGEAVRHLGHLDLQRAMQRALRRSGLPVRYSQGFHPHMLTAFASALSMGVSSEAEIVDVTLESPVTAEEGLQRMQGVLPDALAVRGVRLVEDMHPGLMGRLKQASYDAWLSGADLVAWKGAIDSFLAENEVLALRKSKSGEKLVNIRPMAHAIIAEPDQDRVKLRLRLSLEEVATLKPELLIHTLAQRAQLPVPDIRLHRTGLFGFGADGNPVPLMDL